ncbi:MAG: hypothetical protein ACRDL5_07950 [Solirubrobacteraceae bacterium]
MAELEPQAAIAIVAAVAAATSDKREAFVSMTQVVSDHRSHPCNISWWRRVIAL